MYAGAEALRFKFSLVETGFCSRDITDNLIEVHKLGSRLAVNGERNLISVCLLRANPDRPIRRQAARPYLSGLAFRLYLGFRKPPFDASRVAVFINVIIQSDN